MERPLTAEKIYELLYGEPGYCLPQYYQGYADAVSRDPDITHFISDEMKADWRANRDKLMQLWRGEGDHKHLFGCQRLPWLCCDDDHEWPWAARTFDNKPDTERQEP